MILKNDCRHFPGDRPCGFHKKEKIKCDDCRYYQQKGVQILIIKLDAIGDVLRTTSILQGLKKKYPQSYIIWLTRSNAVTLFQDNQLVDRVFPVESVESEYYLSVQHFDVVINLDPSPISSAICARMSADKKCGFELDKAGIVQPLNSAAESWLEMGAFDDLKKNNKETYQSVLQKIAELEPGEHRILLNLSESEKKFAAEFLLNKKINVNKKIVGMNTGASPRWEYKKWTFSGYVELIEKIIKTTDYYIFLYGGGHEGERNEKLAELHKERVINTGTNNSLREFFALLSLCDVLITGDTLAMHAATALRKKIIALFGPTSYAEIEDYNLIKKIYADLDCLVCYKMDCNFEPNCMNSISSERIYEELIGLL